MKNIDLNDPTTDPKKLYESFRKWCSEDRGVGLWSFVLSNIPEKDHFDLNVIYGGICEWAGISLIDEDNGEKNSDYDAIMRSVISLIRAWEKCGFISVIPKETHRGKAYEVYFLNGR